MNADFVPMYDLERLDADQKAKYYSDACEFLGIPDNLNLLAFIYMNVGDTGRHEVLYAKKGATDLIRQTRGITTTELQVIPNLAPGQVCFMAVGKDIQWNREERAVGAASIEGLTGKALSDAIMTAQTRATRRMTLQFVGGGILDESEVPERGQTTTPISTVTPEAARALDAITTQPVVLPNPTPSVVEPPSISEYHDYRSTMEVFAPSAAQEAANAALTAIKPEVLATAAGEKIADVKELAAKLPANNPLVQAVAPSEAPKQRKRKPAEAAPVAELMSVEYVDPTKSECKECKCSFGVHLKTCGQFKDPHSTPEKANSTVSAVADIPQSQPSATMPAQPVEPPKVTKLLTEEQEKEVRTRLSKYRNEILPAGKMEPIVGVGGAEIQLRQFVQKFNSDKPSSKTWNYIDWLKFLDFLDDYVKVKGAPELVQYMQQKIGVIK